MDRPSQMDPKTPATDDSPRATFESITNLLERWETAGIDNQSGRAHLQQFLDDELNDETDSILDRDIVERHSGSNAADLSVNGEIGIKLVGEVRRSTVDQLNNTLSLLSDLYRFVAVYWLAPSSETDDYRRTVERTASKTGLGLKGLRFVTGEYTDDDKVTNSRTKIIRPVTICLSIFLALVLVGIGVLVRTLSFVTGPFWLLLVGTALVFFYALVFAMIL